MYIRIRLVIILWRGLLRIIDTDDEFQTVSHRLHLICICISFVLLLWLPTHLCIILLKSKQGAKRWRSRFMQMHKETGCLLRCTYICEIWSEKQYFSRSYIDPKIPNASLLKNDVFLVSDVIRMISVSVTSGHIWRLTSVSGLGRFLQLDLEFAHRKFLFLQITQTVHSPLAHLYFVTWLSLRNVE